MFSKRLFIVLIVTLCSVGCSRHTNRGSGPEVLLNSTPVGVPNGPSANKEIGPVGGSLVSTDGRLTITIPANAVSAPVAFVIQPITNKLDRGLGNAYRLEPSGTTFTTPVELSIHFDNHDLEGTVPESLILAYQDEQGYWRALKSGKLDQDKKTLTVSTTHFSDWSFVPGTQLLPGEATVHVRETKLIKFVICDEQTFFQKLFSQPAPCEGAPDTSSSSKSKYTWTVNDIPWGNSTVGTLSKSGNGVIYTAPAKKPSPNVVTVALQWELKAQLGWTGTTITATYDSKITIVPWGYRASGNDGPVVYSGVVCDLEHPFTITGTHPMGVMPFTFVPSSPTAGAMSYSSRLSRIKVGGSGTYTIEGADTDTPRIVLQTQSTATLSITTSGGGTAHINLTKLTGNECDKP